MQIETPTVFLDIIFLSVFFLNVLYAKVANLSAQGSI